MKKKKGGKSTIITDVMAKGFTARTSEKAVTAVINHMKLGLWWGEPVEIPGGTIQAMVRKGKPRHCCPRRDRPVAWPAEYTRLGGTPVGYLGGGLRIKVAQPVQVIPKPG